MGGNYRQYFTIGAKIHQIEFWNIDSKNYPEIVFSEYFGILIPNSSQGILSDLVNSREEYHTYLMQIYTHVISKLYCSLYLNMFKKIDILKNILISLTIYEIIQILTD